jgi:hypothetical protein
MAKRFGDGMYDGSPDNNQPLVQAINTLVKLIGEVMSERLSKVTMVAGAPASDVQQYGQVCTELLQIDIQSNATANAAIVNPIWKCIGKIVKEKGAEMNESFNAQHFFENFCNKIEIEFRLVQQQEEAGDLVEGNVINSTKLVGFYFKFLKIFCATFSERIDQTLVPRLHKIVCQICDRRLTSTLAPFMAKIGPTLSKLWSSMILPTVIPILCRHPSYVALLSEYNKECSDGELVVLAGSLFC